MGTGSNSSSSREWRGHPVCAASRLPACSFFAASGLEGWKADSGVYTFAQSKKVGLIWIWHSTYSQPLARLCTLPRSSPGSLLPMVPTLTPKASSPPCPSASPARIASPGPPFYGKAKFTPEFDVLLHKSPVEGTENLKKIVMLLSRRARKGHERLAEAEAEAAEA